MAASGAGNGRPSTAQARRRSLGHTPPHKPLRSRTEQPWPPGWAAFQEDFRSALALDSPIDQAVAIALLATAYELPRLVANVASDHGLPMDTVFRLSAELTVTVLALWSRQWDFMPDLDDNSVIMRQSAFSAANWPWMAVRAGEPDWRPPSNALCWAEVSAEEHAECARHGEVEEARWAAEEANAAA
jgi:hypothetical protein